jgi:flagellar basal body-associated protein FliL
MPESSNEPTRGRLRPIWLAIGVIFALFVGASAGILAWLSGEKIPAAVLTGGGAFVATITVVILIIGLFPA